MTPANDSRPHGPTLDELLSVRALNALRRIGEKGWPTVDPKVSRAVDLRIVDALHLIRIPEVGPKVIAEIRRVALEVGVDLQNAGQLRNQPAALGPWMVQEQRAVGDHVVLKLHCAGSNLQLTRPKGDAALFPVGTWVRIDLAIVDAPNQEPAPA